MEIDKLQLCILAVLEENNATTPGTGMTLREIGSVINTEEEHTYSQITINRKVWGLRDLGYVTSKLKSNKADMFYMVWKQAYEEVVRLQNEINEKSMKAAREQDELMKNLLDLIPTEEDKPILKKFYRVLANTYHPDNKETGNAEMMGYVNDLKQMWGI